VVAELSVGHVLSVAGLRQLDNAIETTVFTKLISRLMDGDQYRELQEHLIENPAIGNLIQGSGGLRKIRWKIAGRGKRGGVRVIYYWAVSADQIRMLYVYSKTDQEDLTKDQLKVLRQLVEKW
jgi:mRNA-degrading endonuclease RelE of RelBE toxin-antitoxin system